MSKSWNEVIQEHFANDSLAPSVSLSASSGQQEASRHVAPVRRVPDYVLTAVNSKGEWRCSAYVDGDSCLEVAETLREWHETDPQRTLRIVPRAALSDPFLRSVSDEQPKAEDAVAAEPARCQRGGTAETPHPSPNPSQHGDLAAWLEALLNNILRRTDIGSHDTAEDLRRDLRHIAQHAKDARAALQAMKAERDDLKRQIRRELVPISKGGKSVFIEGHGAVALDYDDALLTRAEAAEKALAEARAKTVEQCAKLAEAEESFSTPHPDPREFSPITGRVPRFPKEGKAIAAEIRATLRAGGKA